MASINALSAAADPALNLLWRTASAIRREQGGSLADAVGGAFLEGESGEALAKDAIDRAMSRISGFELIDARMRQAADHAARDLTELGALPDPVREAAYGAIQSGGRWVSAARGLRRLPLPMNSPRQVELLRIEPGCGAPRHDHTGEEYTLVLTGAFHDGHALYQRGDISLGEPGFHHQPVARPGEVCFALAVTDGDVRFDGVLGLLQRLTRH